MIISRTAIVVISISVCVLGAVLAVMLGVSPGKGVAGGGGNVPLHPPPIGSAVAGYSAYSTFDIAVALGAAVLFVVGIWGWRTTIRYSRLFTISFVRGRPLDITGGQRESRYPRIAWSKDLDGRYISASEALAEVYGVASPVKMIGKRDHEFLAPDIAEKIAEFEREAVRSKCGQELDIRIPRNDGEDLCLNAFVLPLLGEQEEVTGLAGWAFDASSYAMADRKFDENEHEFSAVVENSPDTIARYDIDGKRIYANPTLVRMSKAQDVVLIGRTPSETGLKGDMDGYDAAIREVARTGEGAEYELSWFSTDGKEHLTHIRLAPERDGDGNVCSVLAVGRDISRRREMEKELWRREHQFRDLADNSPDSIARYDLNARRLYANATLKKMAEECGIDMKDGLTPTETGYLSPADEYEQSILRAGRTGETVDSEMNWPTSSGKTIISHVRFVPERDADGTVVSVLAVGRDITAYKEMEGELRRSSNNLSAIIDTVPGVVYRKTYSPNGVQVTFISENARSLYPVTLEEVYEMPMEERIETLWHPDDRQEVALMVGKMVSGAKFAETKARLLLADGSYRWLLMRETVSDRQGDRRTVTGLMMDIHDEVTLKAEADVKARQMAAILDNLPDIAWVKDCDSHFVAANRAFAEMVGLSNPDELVGKTDVDFFPREQAAAFQEEDAEVIRSHGIRHVEERITHADGTVLWIDTRKAPIFSESGEVIGSVGMARNITERKAMEEELRETSERLQSIIDNIPGIIYRKTYSNGDSSMTFLSQHARRLYGPAISNLQGMNQVSRVSALWHPEDRHSVLDMLGRISDGAEVAETRARIVMQGGGYNWMLLREVVSSVHDGQTTITGIMFDIDDQVRAEQSVKESSERMEALVKNLPGIAYVKRHSGEDSKIQFVSGLVKETLHLTPEEVCDLSIKERLKDLWHPDDRETILDLNRSMREGGKAWEGRVRRRGVDGTWRWAMIREHAIGTSKDGSILTGGLLIDIDAQVRAENALRETSANLETIMQNIPGDVFRIRYDAQNKKKFEFVDGTTYRNNPAFAKITLRSSDEELRALYSPEYQKLLFEDFPKTLRSQGYATATTQVVLHQEIKWVRIWEKVSRFEGEEMITEGIAIDVTDEVLARQALEEEEAERRKLKDLLAEERRMAALGEVAGGIAHDFNNMLGAIKGYTEFISEDVPPETDAEKYAKRILTTSDRGQERVEQLLILAGRKPLDRTWVGLPMFVEEICTNIQGEMRSIIRFVNECSDVNCECFADMELVWLSVRHLCHNADMATGCNKDITVAVRPACLDGETERRIAGRMDGISPWALEYWDEGQSVHALTGKLNLDQEWISIAVFDDGEGMDAETLSKAFEPFFSTRQRAVNPGLGLPIAQGVALMHGGGLLVRSEPGEGTVVELLLPITNGEKRR